MAMSGWFERLRERGGECLERCFVVGCGWMYGERAGWMGGFVWFGLCVDGWMDGDLECV